jgi:hypothetical protein
VRPELGAPADQVGEPFVPLGGQSRGFGKGAQHLPPTVSGRPDLGVDRVDHQVEQFLPAAVKEYEREMFECTSAAARMSADMQELLMSPDAAGKMLAFFQPSGR